MDKREALEIYLKVHRECMEHKGCLNCPLKEQYGEKEICVFTYFHNRAITKIVEAKLKRISEAPEQKTFVPLENVGSIIVHGPSTIKEPVPLPKDVAKIDNVNRPKHYFKGGLECIQVIKAELTPEQYKGYLYGNVLKYMWRWQDKNGLEDLRKAAKYLEWLIKEVEK